MSEDVRLKRELKVLLVERLRLPGISSDTIQDDDPLVGGTLGLDSIDMLELTLAVEERYGIKFKDEASSREAFRSISSLASFVRDQQDTRQGRGHVDVQPC